MSVSLFWDLDNTRSTDIAPLQQIAEKDYGGLAKLRVYCPRQIRSIWDQCQTMSDAIYIVPPTVNGKNSTDMVLASDFIDEALYGDTDWIGIVSGDVDFLPPISLVKRRTEKKVVVISLVGQLSERLRSAYGTAVDSLVILEPSSGMAPNVAEEIVRQMLSRKPRGGYFTVRLLINYLLRPDSPVLVDGEAQVKEVVNGLRRDGVISSRIEYRSVGGEQKPIPVLLLNETHPFVQTIKRRRQK